MDFKITLDDGSETVIIEANWHDAFAAAIRWHEELSLSAAWDDPAEAPFQIKTIKRLGDL